jgi:hypothetical protein
MNVDPVSGNEVPVGSLPEEVRDDVDAKLSPGEFVIPADVVRFIGLERLMKMRDEAKKGIQRMSDIGQMGNADEVGEESNSTYEDDGFESEIDDILGEVERENGVDDQMKMAFGGYVGSGTDLSKAPKNPVFDVRYYKNAEGSVMYITHINGKPMTPIPEGYKAVTQEEAQKVGQKAEEAAKAETTKLKTDESGDADMTLNKEVEKFLDKEETTPGARDARMGKINTALTKGIQAVMPGAGLMNIVQRAAGLFADQTRPTPAPVETRTGVPVENIRNAEIASTTAYQRASELGLDEVAKNEAGQAAATFARSGMDAQTAARAAVEEQQNLKDIEANQGETGVTGGYSSPGGAYVSDTLTPMAKGGLVNKRQYPAKKKRGKGIAAATK